MQGKQDLVFKKVLEILQKKEGFALEFKAKNGDKIVMKSWYGDESGVFVNSKMVFHSGYNEVYSFTPGDWVEEVLTL